MTDEAKQKKYDECLETLQVLANTLTLALSMGAYLDLSPNEILQKCLDSIVEYDNLTDEEKDFYESQEQELVAMFEQVTDHQEDIVPAVTTTTAGKKLLN